MATLLLEERCTNESRRDERDGRYGLPPVNRWTAIGSEVSQEMMTRRLDPGAYALGVGGAVVLVIGIVFVEPPLPTILLALLAVTLMLMGWLRDRHVRQRRAGSLDR